MASCRRVAVVAVTALLLGAALGVHGSGATAAKSRLVAFQSCDELLAYVKENAAPFVGAYGLGQPLSVPVGIGKVSTPAPAAGAVVSAPSSSSLQQGVDYSGTNVQEDDVDEPDTVKTNGSTLFAVENGSLESVSLAGGRPKLVDTLALDGGWSHELLLSGSHLLVLSRGGYWLQPLPAMAASMLLPQPSTSSLTEVDVSDPASLKVVQTLRLDGAYVDARMVDSTVRIISSSAMPVDLPIVTPAGTSPGALAVAETQNRAAVESSRAKAWLPRYRLGKRAPHSLVQCRRVRRPPTFSGLGMTTVTTIDLAKGLAPVDSTSVIADGRIVYASPTSLYLATEPWTARPLPATPTVAPAKPVTLIHGFSIADARRTSYLGSGTVPGYLLSQWSLSEYKGVLRVVSTDTPAWWGNGPASQTYVTTLRPQSGSLVQLGQIGGLGRGDRVYAVRMLGASGYVVTFKQVDPLYTLDLHDPAEPRQLGELELPGYSSYLHPLSSTLLLGVGQSMNAQGNVVSGTQVSLFDVGDPKHPALLQQAKLGQGWSLAEADHHAFLYWPATNLVVVPFGQQAVALRVSRSGIAELGRIAHNQARQAYLPQIDRSLVAGSALFTVSNAGAAANSLTGLSNLGWAAFPPAPAPKPVPIVVPGPLP